MKLLIFLSHAQTDEQRMRLGKISDKFMVRAVDDFLYRFVLLLFYYPMEDGIKNAFENAENIHQQVGICIRHAIKEAKKSDIPQFFIDYFVSIKNTRDFYMDFETRRIDDQKKQLEKIKQDELSGDELERIYDLGVKNKGSVTRKNMERRKLNKVTYVLLDKLIDNKRQNLN